MTSPGSGDGRSVDAADDTDGQDGEHDTDGQDGQDGTVDLDAVGGDLFPPVVRAGARCPEHNAKWAAGPAAPPFGPRRAGHASAEPPGREWFPPIGSGRRSVDPARSGFFRSGGYGRTCTEVAAIIEKRVRVNDQIRISPIRLIGDDGSQIGIVSLEEARERAEELGLDLVEVAPDARPPVVKIMDYGKFKYEEARAAREARKKQHQVQIKEVKFRPGIEEHDYAFKTRHARRFLQDGNKVRLTMMFRGRQVTHPELGLEVLQRVTQDLGDIARVETQPSFEGRTMTMVLAPDKTR